MTSLPPIKMRPSSTSSNPADHNYGYNDPYIRNDGYNQNKDISGLVNNIKAKFPNAKFIHNIRDPRDNYASMKSRWEKKLKHLADLENPINLNQNTPVKHKNHVR